jgi:hypothetical protein
LELVALLQGGRNLDNLLAARLDGGGRGQRSQLRLVHQQVEAFGFL